MVCSNPHLLHKHTRIIFKRLKTRSYIYFYSRMSIRPYMVNLKIPGSEQLTTNKVLKSSKGKRKYHNKSRKGCTTCKKRRVKCDENKPICNKCEHLGLDCIYMSPPPKRLSSSTSDGSPAITVPLSSGPPLGATANSPSNQYTGNLNMLDLRLMYHYITKVWHTITAAGISDAKIWCEDIPMLAFNYPFLMHSILAFSATHLSRTEKGLDQCVTCHRGDALRLLREAVLEISPANTDALVASALILIMDSLANASLPTSTSPKSLPASAWIFHVKGAATILTAVWPLNESSRFHKFISVDLSDLGDVDLMGDNAAANHPHDVKYSQLLCFDEELTDLFPVTYTSPYLITLAYLNKLHNERYKSDFILRVFAFPALLDKTFLTLLINGDISAMRIMRSYYTLLRNFTDEMKDKVWFLEGVSKVLPVDVDEYSGGGGMHMMMDFLGGPSTLNDNDTNDIADNIAQSGLLDTDNLPSSITDNLDIMHSSIYDE